MTPRDIELVRSTRAEIAPHAHGTLFAERFYAVLFDSEPNIRPLFGGDLKAQAGKRVIGHGDGERGGGLKR